MRNLKLNYCHRWRGLPHSSQSACLSVDFDTGDVYISSGTLLAAVSLLKRQMIQSICLKESGHIDDDTTIIAIQHVMDQQSLAVALAGGSLLLWSPLSNSVEEVGCVASGLRAMAWSPDHELLVLATGADSLIMMSREFDPISEMPIPSEESANDQFVNVGWGKRETQFQGSVGKAAAVSNIEPVIAAPCTDDRRSRISWRGDGQMFVVSSINSITDARQLTIWSREGTLQSVSENVNGLEHSLVWKPTGSLIASTKRTTDGLYEVVFFEKNSLRHGLFSLPFTTDTAVVRELLWNADSTLLAVWCDSPSLAIQSQVLIYAVNNYHWYLKQTLPFNQPIGSVCWHPEHVYSMHIVCKSGDLLQYTWSWATNHSEGRDHMDLANVAVIDGVRVLLTPFRTMIVPPPYCAYQINTKTAVNQVAFGPPMRSNDFALLTCDGTMYICTFKKLEDGDVSQQVDGAVECVGVGGVGFDVKCQLPSLQTIVKLPVLSVDSVSTDVSQTSHMTWLHDDSFILIGPATDGINSVIYHLQLTPSSHDPELIVMTSTLTGIAFNVCGNHPALVLHTLNGSLWNYTSGSLEIWKCGGEEIKLPHACTSLAVCTIGGQEAVIGLTDRFRLYVNNIEIATNCTSFAIHSDFILLTTLSHTCRCISRYTNIKDLPSLSDGKEHPFDESIRRIERGSRIVTVVTDDTKLVLQMPRGNLETIHPRALVLSYLRMLLDQLSFGKAFSVMRKHRINLNLLHDHNPTSFLQNITQFVTQLSQVGHINLFLSDLIADDVTVTMYTVAYKDKRVAVENGGKVDKICDAVRTALVDVDPKKYLLSIITSHVRKTTPDFETVLSMIKTLSATSPEGHVTRGDALTYALFLVDVNQMYDVALGMYDFELVVMVADRSQKDPKEYLPFLNELRRLDGAYQKFTIDKHLKRHSKALAHIAQCTDRFNECLSYIKEHKLYVEALRLYQHDRQQYREIAGCYGEHLSSNHKHDQAGVVFFKAHNWRRALECYEKCGNWKQAVCMGEILQMGVDERRTLYLRLAKSLHENKHHHDAALVYEHYLKDVEEAISVLIEGCQWDDAIRLMYRYSRTDFIDTHLKPHLTNTCTSHLSTLSTMAADFVKYRNRLAIVRETKERLVNEELLDGEGDLYRGVDADLYSDAASAMGDSVVSTVSTNSQRSNYSKTSGRSSRNKRKAERKKWSLKENSPNEDLALMEALAKIVTYVNNIQDDVHSLLMVLVMYNFDKEATTLQHELQTTLDVIEQSKAVIWPPLTNNDIHMGLGPESTAENVVQARLQGRQLHTDTTIDTTPCQAPTVTKKRWTLDILDIDKKVS